MKLLRPSLLSPVVIVLLILVANVIYLSGLTNPNPINTQSGLQSQSHGKLLGGLDTIDPNDGTSTQSLGHAATRQIVHGHLPWWNYDEQVGAPLAGDMQSAALFPLTLILGLSNGVLFFHIVLEVIAGLAMYYLLKRLGCRELAAVTGGTLFALNGTFAWLGNAAFNPVAFLPLMILGIEIAYDRTDRGEKRGWFVLALALALSLYAGFPETVYLDGWLAGLWVLVRLGQLRHGPWRALLGKLLLGGLVGLLLAAPILIAFIDYTHHAYLGVHSGVLANAALPYVGLPMLVFPYIYGTIFGYFKFDPSGTIPVIWDNVGGYLTLPLVFLAVLGSLGKAKRPLKILLAAWVLVTVLRAYGLLHLSDIIGLLPGMDSVAFYRYVQPSFEFAAIVLAMLGLDRLVRAKTVDKRQVYKVTAGLAVVLVAMLLIANKGHHLLVTAPHHNLVMVASVAWGLGCVAVIIACLVRPFKYWQVACSAVLVVDAMLMFAIPNLSALRSPAVDTKPVKFLQANLGDERFFSLGPLAANYGSYYSLASINTDNLPLSQSWANYIKQSLDPYADPVTFGGTRLASPMVPGSQDEFFAHLNAYEYMGVKYLVTSPNAIGTQQLASVGLKLVFKDDTASIYQLPAAQPYFQVISGACRLTVRSKAQLSVNCSQPSQLLRRELYEPGWTVSSSGGQALSVKQRGPLFQSVALPRGHYTLSFNYLPPHMLAGLIMFLMGWVVALVAYWTRLKTCLLRGIPSRR